MKEALARFIEPKMQIDDGRKLFDNAALIALIVPIIIEQFLAMLVGLADTAMISYAGEAAVSGVSLVNQLNSVYILIFSALASGGAVVASQYLGSKNKKLSSLAGGQLITLGSLIGIVVTVFTLIFGRQIFDALFGAVESDVLSSGLTYLRISAYSYIFLALYNACAGLYRSMGKTKDLMFISIIMNAINVGGNAIGIFVFHAGVAGVAYPSLISRAFAAIVMLVLLFKPVNPITLSFSDVFSLNGSMLYRIFKIALPGSIENGLFQVSKVALSSIIAGFGTAQIAAYGIVQNFWAIAALFSLALAPAFITIIGRYMGAGDIEGAMYYMKKLLRFTYLGSLIWNLTFFILTPFLLMFYNIGPETHRLIMTMVIIHNIFNVLIVPVAFSLPSGLRAAGDVKFNMYSSIFATVICRVAFSVLFGIVLNMGVIGVTCAMIVDWGAKAALTWYRYKSKKWTTFKVI